jgi:hypothetical protein
MGAEKRTGVHGSVRRVRSQPESSVDVYSSWSLSALRCDLARS